MSSTVSPFFTGMVIVLIIHFSIKHYLLYIPNQRKIKRVRFNTIPEINEIPNITSRDQGYLKSIDTRFSEDSEITKKPEDTINVKSELLQYVKDYGENSSSEQNNLIYESDGEDNINVGEDDNDDLSKYFQIANNDNYVFTETPTSKDDEVLDELPIKLDVFSKDPVFKEEVGSENTLSKDRWKYANEKTINGGIENGDVKAYDNFNMSDNFAMFGDAN